MDNIQQKAHDFIANNTQVADADLQQLLTDMSYDYYPKERWDLAHKFAYFNDKDYLLLLGAIQNKNMGLIAARSEFVAHHNIINDMLSTAEAKLDTCLALQYASNQHIFANFDGVQALQEDPFYQAISAFHQSKWQALLVQQERQSTRDNMLIFMACEYCNAEIDGDEQSLEEALIFHLGQEIAPFWLEQDHKPSNFFYPKHT